MRVQARRVPFQLFSIFHWSWSFQTKQRRKQKARKYEGATVLILLRTSVLSWLRQPMQAFPVLSDAWEGDNLRFFLVFISYFHACKGAHGPFMCFHWFQPGYAPCGQIILASAFHISYNAASPPWAVEFSFAMCGQLIMGAMGFPAEKWTAHDVLPSKTSSKGPNASSSFSINSVSSNPYIGGKTVISFAKTSLRRSMS